MFKIKILPEYIQNQIAAGEVVERPASIVKELVENALDAHSDVIQVEIEDGGIKLIRVTDNGAGIEKEDLPLLLTRYATSKISSIDDLAQISSFGFRGEALASISSVSEVIVQTKTKANLPGYKLTTTGAQSIKIEETGCPPGTVISIKDLFQKIPVRRKYLKSVATEYQYILEKFQNFALIHVDKSFKLLNNKRLVLDLKTENSNFYDQALENRIIKIFGQSLVNQLLKVEFNRPDLIIKGYVAKPSIARSSRKFQYQFINKRDIKSSLISAAVLEAFKNLLLPGKYPFYVLDIQITADLIDVNVHPRKEEIRFLNQNDLYRTVRGAVENALKGEKTITINEPDQLASSIHNYSPKQKFSDQYRYNAVNIPQAIAFSKEILNPRTLSNPSLNQKNISLPSFESISKQNDRIIGQLKNSYILVETAEGLLLLDQHAVHERIRYEKLITNFKQQKKDAQKLLIPIEIDLSLGEINLLRQHLHLFKELGFDLELSNQQTCQITAIPNALIAQDPAEMIRSLIDEFDSFKPEKGQTIDNLAEIIIIFLACRKSIMFGDPLHFTEMEQLYHDWQRCSQKETCPHGRQLSWVITWEEMRHKVNRN